jgi:hypothetical protein
MSSRPKYYVIAAVAMSAVVGAALVAEARGTSASTGVLQAPVYVARSSGFISLKSTQCDGGSRCRGQVVHARTIARTPSLPPGSYVITAKAGVSAGGYRVVCVTWLGKGKKYVLGAPPLFDQDTGIVASPGYYQALVTMLLPVSIRVTGFHASLDCWMEDAGYAKRGPGFPFMYDARIVVTPVGSIHGKY